MLATLLLSSACCWVPLLIAAAGFAAGESASTQEVRDQPLAGHWVADVVMAEAEGDSVRFVVDLARLETRWVGEFDVPDFGIEDYPVQVTLSAETIALHFAGPDADFTGKLSEAGNLLSGTLRFGEQDVPTSLQRMGEAQFSKMFWELEAAADDSTRVTRLSSLGTELRDQFNADKNKARLLLLLSPT